MCIYFFRAYFGRYCLKRVRNFKACQLIRLDIFVECSVPVIKKSICLAFGNIVVCPPDAGDERGNATRTRPTKTPGHGHERRPGSSADVRLTLEATSSRLDH